MIWRFWPRLDRFRIEDRSMEPALAAGDRVWVRRSGAPIERGALVVFPHPRRTGMWLVKRVIGLAGEAVTIDFGEVMIDGRGGLDRWGAGPTIPDGRWLVDERSAFVLSDNRLATRDDSRNFGPVPIRSLLRVILRR